VTLTSWSFPLFLNTCKRFLELWSAMLDFFSLFQFFATQIFDGIFHLEPAIFV
jgi:hypothetical protein